MKLAVVCDDDQKNEFLSKKTTDGLTIVFTLFIKDIPPDTDVVVDLLYDNNPERIFALKQFLPRPVIIHSVGDTLAAIGFPFIRINSWPGFLQRDTVEISAIPQQHTSVRDLFTAIGWSFRIVPDLPGMVTARIISSIINEAYFTLEAGVSSKEEIDIAMKTGTNYPLGPFEWSSTIGLKKVYAVLLQLCKEDMRYTVSPLLVSEALQAEIKMD